MKMISLTVWVLTIGYDGGTCTYVYRTRQECLDRAEAWARENTSFDDKEDEERWDNMVQVERIDDFFNNSDYESFEYDDYTVEFRADELQELIYKATLR